MGVGKGKRERERGREKRRGKRKEQSAARGGRADFSCVRISRAVSLCAVSFVCCEFCML